MATAEGSAVGLGQTLTATADAAPRAEQGSAAAVEAGQQQQQHQQQQPSVPLKPFACVACVQRKVRCDKRQPCSSCTRLRLPCRYRTGPLPPRRKRRLTEPNPLLLSRQQAYEATLRRAGLLAGSGDEDDTAEVDAHTRAPVNAAGDAVRYPPPAQLPTRVEPPQGSSLGPPPAAPPRAMPPGRGILVAEHGGRRYYEYGLLGTLGQEFRQEAPRPVGEQYSSPGTTKSPNASSYGPQPAASDALASSIVTGSIPSLHSRHQHPPAQAVTKYWTVFLENVHPLTKVIYAPQVHPLMMGNVPMSPRGSDALRFAIYACAVASLPVEDCSSIFGASPAMLLDEFQAAARDALFETSFLKVPDLDLLRALVLLITSMLHTAEPSVLWTQMGSAIRMAQSQGLHRDGSALGLSPFETEMRRRLWWYMVTLDGRLTELIGAESSLQVSMDTLLPSNVNDNNLSPDMTTSPATHPGATDMTFCLVRYEIAQFLRDHDPRADESRGPVALTVTDLESLLEARYLRFCDPIVPLQFLTTASARSSLCRMRQMAQHRTSRHYAKDAGTMSQEQRNLTLNAATRNVEYDNLIHSTRSLRGFLWHADFHIPWGAPIFILKILASSPEWDDDMQAAWGKIEDMYDNHAEYILVDKIPHLILGNLTLLAWAARWGGLRAAAPAGPWEQRPPPVPGFIAALQTKHAARRAAGAPAGNAHAAKHHHSAPDAPGMVDHDFIMDPTFLTEVDWMGWGGY